MKKDGMIRKHKTINQKYDNWLKNNGRNECPIIRQLVGNKKKSNSSSSIFLDLSD